MRGVSYHISYRGNSPRDTQLYFTELQQYNRGKIIRTHQDRLEEICLSLGQLAVLRDGGHVLLLFALEQPTPALPLAHG